VSDLELIGEILLITAGIAFILAFALGIMMAIIIIVDRISHGKRP
jgi:hypothetical protein